MNPKLAPLFSRRSVRQFTTQPVDDALIQDLLQAAMAAPSAMQKDPWRYIVVRQREILKEMARLLPHGRMLRSCRVALIACGDRGQVHDGEESFLLQDVSASIENILLAATILGLGSCWVGLHPRKERMAAFSALLQLPENVIPVSGIALGWPAKSKEARTRYQEEYVHYEHW
ncbi:nitroreductase family protein [Desulfogranum japonicum]|uniref:nitroreductase family protein n=1 Tax=Desulfogranum japonicum TaxID=231447 RepID=UPI000420FFC6|nr:nitroreductase family protein [Desulfogranum japonicum]